MELQLVSNFVQVVVVLGSWEGWRALRVWLEHRKANGVLVAVTPKATNGFDREDHGLLMVVASRIDRMEEQLVKIGDVEQELARMASALEWYNTHPR